MTGLKEAGVDIKSYLTTSKISIEPSCMIKLNEKCKSCRLTWERLLPPPAPLPHPPSSSSILQLSYLSELLYIRSHKELAHSHCRISTLFAPAWCLLSQEFIMPVPCMAGPMPGRWQCSPLSSGEETVQTSLLCSYEPHAGPGASPTTNSIWRGIRVWIKNTPSWDEGDDAALLKSRPQ